MSLAYPEEPDDELNEALTRLADHELAIYRWSLQRRTAQTAPTPLPLVWFIVAGRGAGKTLTATNHIFELACNLPHTPKNRIVRVAMVGETFGDVKATVVEGETGFRSIIPRSCEIAWNRSIGELMVRVPPSQSNPHYREIHFFSYTSERPDQLRGPQHHLAIVDEPAKFKDADQDPEEKGTTWSNLMFGLRLGATPHVVVSGTPTPCRLVKYLAAKEDSVITRMSTWDNKANLPPSFIKEFERLSPTSRTARQEIYAEILMDNPDALFDQEIIDANRAAAPAQQAAQGFKRVLGYDPAPSSGEDSDEAGIVTATYGIQPHLSTTPADDLQTHAYIESDLSGHYTPKEQTALVVKTLLDPLKPVDVLLFEQNQGVDFVMDALLAALSEQTKSHTIRKMKPPRTDYGVVKRFKVTATRHPEPGAAQDGGTHTFMILAIHATKGKQIRAELASARYETGQVHHPEAAALPTCLKSSCKTSLESQMTSWNPTKNQASPDRLDACFVAGTLVSTSKGQTPIEHIVIGDLVETREGWKPVIVAGPTRGGIPVPVVSVALDNGEALTGTPDHPIWVVDRGWVRLDSLVYGDMLLPCANTLSFRELVIRGTQKRKEEQQESIIQPQEVQEKIISTGRFGSQSTEKSRRGTLSTTLMRTLSIMRLAISSAYPVQSMGSYMPRSTLNQDELGQRRLGRYPWSGIVVKKVGHGIENMLKKLWLIQPLKRFVVSATRPSSRLGMAIQNEGSAQLNAARDYTQESDVQLESTTSNKTAKCATRSLSRINTQVSAPVHVVAEANSLVEAIKTVYNLEVAGAPEFFANGVLVHNCVYTLLFIFGQSGRSNTGPSSLAGPSAEPLTTQTLERPVLTPQKKEPRGIELWSVDMMESSLLPYE